MSDSLGLVDFVMGLVDFVMGLVIFVLNLPDRQVFVFGNSNYRRIVLNPADQKGFGAT